jgi:hypothetical protein
LKGILTTSFGSPLGFPEATVTLIASGSSDIVVHPNSLGAFTVSAKPGVYTLRGFYRDPASGILLAEERTVQLTENQTTDIGVFELTDTALMTGWSKYQSGDFAGAEQQFLDYLDRARSGQSSLGSVSAYSALGWTRANGLDNPTVALNDFTSALDAWDGNVDARVGFAGAELSRMKSDGGHFKFNDAIQAINQAIDSTGDYSSAPIHDSINEIDLRAYRALLYYLVGNEAAARNEALSIQDAVAMSGNEGSREALALVLKFTE